MSKQHIYYPFTTSQQRKFLFETWEEAGNVSEACRKAHVGRTTFYYWKKRFDEHALRRESAFLIVTQPHREISVLEIL